MLIETYEVVVLKRPFAAAAILCPVCAENAVMVSPAAAAQLFDISLRDIYRQVETAAVHYTEGIGEPARVCLRSLSAAGRHKN